MLKSTKKKNSIIIVFFILISTGVFGNASGKKKNELGNLEQISSKYFEDMTSLRRLPPVEKAMKHIANNDEKVISDMIFLNEIPAPPFKEKSRANALLKMFLKLGLVDVKIDKVGNVLARRAGIPGKSTIAVVAHIDTVFPEGTDVTVKIEGNKYTAPGIADNTRGLAAMLAVARALQDGKIVTNSDILFVGSVGEEGLGDLRGVKYLLRDGGPSIDSFIAIDGGEKSRLVYGAVGSHRYRVTFRGSGGHSWSDFRIVNPNHAMGRAIEEISVVSPSIYATGPKVSISVGRIGGGTSVNSIPFESWMEVDMRSGDVSKLEEMDNMFKDAIKTALIEENMARSKGSVLTVEVEDIGVRPAGLGDKNAPLVQRAMAAMRSLEIIPSLAISSTDANIAISKKISAITLSRGGVSKATHSPQESWQNIDGHIGIQLILLTILAESGVVH